MTRVGSDHMQPARLHDLRASAEQAGSAGLLVAELIDEILHLRTCYQESLDRAGDHHRAMNEKEREVADLRREVADLRSELKG